MRIEEGPELTTDVVSSFTAARELQSPKIEDQNGEEEELPKGENSLDFLDSRKEEEGASFEEEEDEEAIRCRRQWPVRSRQVEGHAPECLAAFGWRPSLPTLSLPSSL